MIRMHTVFPIGTLLLAITLATGSVRSQAPPKCQGTEYHQFDFWIGEWNVTSPDGERVGSRRASATMDGCVIREEWVSDQVRGTSLSVYDRPRGGWMQTWVDNRGVHLRLEGGYGEGAMTLSGTRLEGDGVRRTWRPTGECEVRQAQCVSEDGGETWVVVFEGIYRPVDGRCARSDTGDASQSPGTGW